MPNKKSSAVKKAWAEANKLHKAVLESSHPIWDASALDKTTPALARRYNSLMKKSQAPIPSNPPTRITNQLFKVKVLEYSKWLIDQLTLSNEGEESPQISSEETPVIRNGTLLDVENEYDYRILQSISETCKTYQVTPQQFATHVKILENLQVLDFDGVIERKYRQDVRTNK